jgi:hypothetical protein
MIPSTYMLGRDMRSYKPDDTQYMLGRDMRSYKPDDNQYIHAW